MKRLLPIVLLFTTACAQSGLPPIGAEIPMSMLAINVPVKIQTSLVLVDFRGGIKQRVEVNPDDPINSRRLRIVGFKMSAELPENDGTLTIEQNDVDEDAKSLLKLTQRFPPRYEHVNLLSFTLTIDHPDEPLVLITKDPMKLIGTLTQFPPKGDLYQLQNPVDLVLPDDPNTTLVTIQKFPVKIGGL
ncbi:hypothetical protein EC968_002146 [Mortierella alpina]|nr:hypothetical protein EC968_002146 [Mortierella alpina]